MAASPELTNAYRQRRQTLFVRLVASARQAFLRGLENERRTIVALIALVSAGQAAMVRLVEAYLASAAGRAPRGLPADRYTVTALRSDPFRVYSQPFAVMTVALMAGEPRDVALASGEARVEKLVATDLQLAQTHAARDVMVAPGSGIVGWERVPRANACALCQLAAGRIYHMRDLMPIHEHCECGIKPVVEAEGAPAHAAIDAAVRVVASDIGPRLLAADWKG